MGSASSSAPKVVPSCDISEERKQLLLQRKVTTDILEMLARRLPTVVNPLGRTLRLNKDARYEIEWKENLCYLEEWKRSRKDEATIGNLIETLKKSGHTADEYECLFNISREPRNASTTTDRFRTEHNRLNTHLSPHTAFNVAPRINGCSDSLILPHDFNFMAASTQCHKNLKQNSNPINQSQRKDRFQIPLYDPPDQGCSFQDSRQYKPLHKWTDFRSFGEVHRMTPFINKSLSDPRIGNYVPGVACTTEAVIASDAVKRCVHLFCRSGKLIQSLSTREYVPGGICWTREENFAVCCGRVVALWDRDGRVNGHFGDGVFTWCRGICSDSSNRLIVADTGKRSVTIHDSGGGVITALQLPQGKTFVKPYHVTVNYKDDILVSDTSQCCVYSFDKNGTFIRTWMKSNFEKNLDVPMGVISDCAGNVLVSNYGNKSFDLFSNEGWFLNELIGKKHLSHRPVNIALMGEEKVLVSLMKEDPLHLIDFS